MKMFKYSLNRWILRNRGFLFTTFNSNLIVRTSDKMNPKVVGVLSAVPKHSYQNITSVRGMNTKSQIRQNYQEECEDGINKQINMELFASYVYLAMAYHFDRDDIAQRNVSKYFKKCSREEHAHAMKFMKFQNLRGGTIVLDDIKAPNKSNWENALEAMEDALELEKTVNQALLNLHKIASKHQDAQMVDFLESEYLNEQVKDIKKFGTHVTNLKRVGSGLGEYIFDKKLK